MPKTKALVLFSGGLDSIVAVKLLQKQNIETTGVCFYSAFYGCEKAEESARNLGIDLITVDVSEEMLAIVKNPACGYGKNLNPCIDCHAMMIRRADALAREKEFSFIATGEVLGQRPFSQNKEALGRVQKLAGCDVLRPLSAKLLDETEIEKSGLVKRGLLERISGRDRSEQMELAKRFQIGNYPSPAGGCLLTDPAYSERLGVLLEHWPDCNSEDADILKYGRVFWLNAIISDKEKSEKILVVVGRNQAENEGLKRLAKRGDFMVELKGLNGPLTLVRTRSKKLIFDQDELSLDIPKKLDLSHLDLSQEKTAAEIQKTAALLTGMYSVKARGSKNSSIKIINHKS